MGNADFDNRGSTPRNNTEWCRLMERYYEGDTSPREERELAAFLLSPQAGKTGSEADRAVIVYELMVHRLRSRQNVRPVSSKASLLGPMWRVAVAVAGLLLVGGGAAYYGWYRSQNSFSVSIYGEKYVQEEVLRTQLQRALEEVFAPIPTPEEQLTAVFGELNPAFSDLDEVDDNESLTVEQKNL